MEEVKDDNFIKKCSKVFILSDDDFSNIINKSKNWVDIGNFLGYKNTLSSNVKKSIELRCSALQLNLTVDRKEPILNKTKKELFKNRKNWQSARSAIQKNARKVFFNNTNMPKCIICGYDKHIEVAHIKSVSEFDDNATIQEINSIDNLVGLCPNHHWEYDNNILKLHN